MAKQKFYVVWEGRRKGEFTNWDECKRQIENYPGAVYISFLTRPQAEQAFNSPHEDYIHRKVVEEQLTEVQKTLIGSPVLDSISVDGVWNTATGMAEYQGVYTKDGMLLFKNGPYHDGTNNVVEFLGIV